MRSPATPSPFRSTRNVLLLFLLAGLFVPASRAVAEDEDRVKGADWIFWYQDGANLYDEAYLTKQACEAAAKEWNQQSPRSPIAFPCAKIGKTLLAQAHKRCKKKEALACQWEKKIEMDLKESEGEKERD